MSDRREDLRRQFGTMWKMASDGLDTLREVVVRSSQTGRLRVDVAFLAKEKQQLLARLGAQVVRLVDEGKLQVPEALQHICARIEDVDARMNADVGRTHDIRKPCSACRPRSTKTCWPVAGHRPSESRRWPTRRSAMRCSGPR